MMLPWREAQIVGVFGKNTKEALKRLKEDARCCGYRAITVVDTGNGCGTFDHRHFLHRQRDIANAINGIILIDLRLVKPGRRNAVLQLADYAVAAGKGATGLHLDLITRDGHEIPLAFDNPSESQR